MIDAATVAAGRRPAHVPAVAVARKIDGERLALVLTAVVVAMLPLAVPQGPGNTVPLDVLIAIALGACVLWAGTARRRWRFPYAVAMAAFTAGGALGALAGPLPGTGLVALIQDMVLVAWCWAVVNIGYSSSTLRVLVRTWAYSSVAWAVLAFVGIFTGSSLLTGQTENQGSRLQLTLADPSYAANYFFISIMIIWASGYPRRRGFRLAAYALLISALAMTGSNSGAVALVAGTVVATVIGLYRRGGIVPATTALAFIVVGGYLVASNLSLATLQNKAHDSRYAFIRDGLGRGTSLEQRDTLLHESMRLYREGSLLGEGPVSTKPRLQKELAPFAKEAHDDYAAALTERGALGFVGVLLLVSAVGLRTLAVARRKLADGFAAVVIRPNALAGAVVGTMVAGTVYELLHVRHVWTLFGIVAALAIWGRE
jgi:O-Antigen ligase